jgi:hypothetical protein
MGYMVFNRLYRDLVGPYATHRQGAKHGIGLSRRASRQRYRERLRAAGLNPHDYRATEEMKE